MTIKQTHVFKFKVMIHYPKGGLHVQTRRLLDFFRRAHEYIQFLFRGVLPGKGTRLPALANVRRLWEKDAFGPGILSKQNPQEILRQSGILLQRKRQGLTFDAGIAVLSPLLVFLKNRIILIQTFRFRALDFQQRQSVLTGDENLNYDPTLHNNDMRIFYGKSD